MGTITTRQGKSGALRHTAQIRLKRDGQLLYTESRTFGTSTQANEWMRSREVELRRQLTPGKTTARGSISSNRPSRKRAQGGYKSDCAITRTLLLLIAEFGSGQILVSACCHYFGMSPEEAKRAAARQALPVPTFRLGSQKSPWVISALFLADYIDKRSLSGEEDWERLRYVAQCGR